MSGASLPPGRWPRAAARGVVLVMAMGTAVFFATVREDTWARLADARWSWLACAPALAAIAWACNGARTWLLAPVVARKIRYREALGVTLAVEFALAATPGGLGGVPLRIALSRRLGVPPEASVAIVAADVAADLIFFALLWPFALLAVLALLARSGLSAKLEAAWSESHPLPWVLGLALLAMVVCGALWTAWRRRREGGRLDRAGAALARTAGKVGLIWRAGKIRFAAIVAVAAVQWTCRYGILPLTLHALGVDAPVLPLMILQGCLFMVSLLVVMPGGGGSVELLSGVLLPLFVPAALVGPAVLIWRVCTYHLYVLAGGFALWMQLRRGATLPSEAESPAVAERIT